MFYQGQTKVKFLNTSPFMYFLKWQSHCRNVRRDPITTKKSRLLKHKHQYGCSTIKNDIISHLVYSEQQKLSKPTRLDCNKYYLATNIL